MKIRKLLPVLVCLLLVATHVPLGAADAPSLLWNFTGSYDPLPIGPFPEEFEIQYVPASPAVDDHGHIYVGSMNGYFFALYRDGNLKWVNADLGGVFAYTPAIGDNGLIYAHNGNGLFAFDPHDGEVLWSTSVPCLFLGAPAIARDGTVYIGSNSDRLFAFTPELEKKWEFRGAVQADGVFDFGVYGNPVIGVDGTVYCIQTIVKDNPTGENTIKDSSLYAITPGDLHSVGWGLRPPHAFYTDISPAVTGNRLYVGTQGGWLYSWSIPQNDLQIFYEWGWADAGSPIIGADGTVYAPFGRDLLALHPADGSEQWAVRSPGEKLFETPAIGADGTIYVGTWGNIGDGAASISVGEICAFHPDGSLDWVWSVIGQVHSSPAIVKYRTESGGQFALYIGLHDSLLAMNVDSPGVAESPWPMDRGNLKRNARCGDAMIRMLLSFREKVVACKFPINIQTSLVSKLAAAQQSLIKEKVKPAKNQVVAFIHEVRALRGKKILTQDADRLIIAAERIVSFL